MVLLLYDIPKHHTLKYYCISHVTLPMPTDFEVYLQSVIARSILHVAL